MIFGIEKCVTMVIKPMNFQSPPNCSGPTFYLGMNTIPKVPRYVYLGISFSDDLLLEHIISHIHFKVRKSLLSFKRFFSNKIFPIVYKKKVLQFAQPYNLNHFQNGVNQTNCIIKDLIKSIPKMPYYSWTEESRALYKKKLIKKI